MDPVANANGTGVVTLIVSDGTLTAQDTFVLTVVAVNDAPTISDITNKTTAEDTPISVDYLIADVDNTLNCSAAISLTSTNTTLLPIVNITKS